MPAFSAAVGVIYRVHRGAAHRRANAQMAHAPSFAMHHVFMIDIAHLPYRGHALFMEESNLP